MRQSKGQRIFLGVGAILGAILYVILGNRTPVYLVIAVFIAALGGVLLGWSGTDAPKVDKRRSKPSMTERDITDEPHIARTLSQLTRVINSTLEMNQILNTSLAYLAQVVSYDTAAILLSDGLELTIAACRGWAEADMMISKTISVTEDDVLAQVMRRQQTQIIPDAQQAAGWQAYYGDNEAAQTIRSWIGAPFVVQGESIGLLTVEKQEPNFYSAQESEIAATFAAQIASAVQNARLFSDLRHRALETAVMADNLNEEKSKLDAIIRHIADGLVVTDAEGTIQLVNPAFEQMFSRPATTLADRSLTQIEELQRLITNVLDDRNLSSVTDISLSDGRILRASSGIIQEETRMLGAVTVLRDITREREVDRMKSEFISTVSHELRTPLTSVLGFTRHITKVFYKNLVPKISKHDRKGQRAIDHIGEELEIIIGEGERLTRLINDLLDIAKMESGKLEWHLAEVSIERVIHKAVAAASSLATARDLPVAVDIQDDLPPVWADEDRLIQVVTNLLSNAIKFTDEGRVKIEATRLEILENGVITPLSLEPLRAQYTGSLQAGTWVVVSVQDTGVGISEANLPYVFEKFKQVGDVLTDRPQGTGLGIPICKEIIEQHGGRIWADSEVGEGSTFTFALPVAPQMMTRASSPDASWRRPVAPWSDSKRGQLILVVDDEVNIRNLLRQELAEAGYRVIEADNGLDALTKARQQKPDLIILDVMMPGLNGFDVTSILKGDQATVHIPILILSIVEDKERVFHLGVEEYLTKPLETDKLLEAIADLLAQAERRKSHEKVLIIDKNTTTIEAVAGLLQEKEYEVISSQGGAEGVKKAIQERPDFIIVNAPLSYGSDYNILKTLRKETDRRNAPIIFLTNTISPEEVAQMLE